jgi:hypothetical protein
MPRSQQTDQVKSVHSRHVLVDDETPAERQIFGAQQLRCRRVDTDREAFNLERELERIANGLIIVDDHDDEARNRQFALRVQDCAHVGTFACHKAQPSAVCFDLPQILGRAVRLGLVRTFSIPRRCGRECSGQYDDMEGAALRILEDDDLERDN